MKKIIHYGSLLIIGFFIFSLANFFILVRPFRLNIPTDPGDAGVDFQDFTLTTEDGKDISALYFDDGSERAIIFLHGYPANKRDLIHTADNFSSYFSTLLLDFRYFGESEGNFTTLGAKEIFDVVAAIDFLEAEGYESIGIFGYSMGGSIALRVAAMDERVDAVVTLGAFADIGILADDFYSYLGPFRKPFLLSMNLWSKIFFGQAISSLSPALIADQIEYPVLLAHGREDQIVSFKHAEILTELIGEGEANDFYFFEDGGHDLIPTSLIQRSTIFFQNNL